MNQYEYPTGDFISGFGGEYEATCQKMVIAGVRWFDTHPKADPKFKGWKNIYGIIIEDNEDAKALSKAVVEASYSECTGAMQQATISHIMWIKMHSWEEYLVELQKPRGV